MRTTRRAATVSHEQRVVRIYGATRATRPWAKSGGTIISKTWLQSVWWVTKFKCSAWVEDELFVASFALSKDSNCYSIDVVDIKNKLTYTSTCSRFKSSRYTVLCYFHSYLRPISDNWFEFFSISFHFEQYSKMLKSLKIGLLLINFLLGTVINFAFDLNE